MNRVRSLAERGSVSLPACPEGTATPSNVREAMECCATFHFQESNNKKSPQWRRRAHAHAWAGVLSVLGVYDAFTGMERAKASQHAADTREVQRSETTDPNSSNHTAREKGE